MLTQAILDVYAERKRQIESEGFTYEMDDLYTEGEMPSAAICYASQDLNQANWHQLFRQYWPWDGDWFKPKGHRRNLVKAAALIIAEIERIDRNGKTQ